MAHREVVICSPVRTAIGTYGGSLKDTPGVDLGAAVVRANPRSRECCAGQGKLRGRAQRDPGRQ